MKKIGIDARLYFQTGVGVYLRNFIHYLQQLDLPDFQFYIYTLADDAEHIPLTKENYILRKVSSRWHTFSEQIQFLGDLNKDNLDLMHFTYFSYPVLYQRKFIATIHDVTPRIFKTGKASTRNPLIFNLKHRAFKFVLTSQIMNASTIITPTKSVKQQIIDIYGEKVAGKILPIYEGVDFELAESEENKDLIHRFPHDFMLYVGNFYPHKNIEKLIQAFRDLDQDIQLILVGPNNYFSERIKYQLKQQKVQNIFLYHYAKTPDLVYFYKHAKALINPSLSEGFGLPLLEAAYFNLPVIASDLPVFHELLGNNFMFFNPSSKEDIQAKITSFLRQTPSFDYSDILSRYSFKKMTDEIVEVYKNALN